MARDIIEFAGKLARRNNNGEIEVSRLMNAKTGELGWFVVPNPTTQLLNAMRLVPHHSSKSGT